MLKRRFSSQSLDLEIQVIDFTVPALFMGYQLGRIASFLALNA